MHAWHLLAAATPTLARSVRRSLYRLGGLGFIPLGLLDSSVIPLPGSMDVLTIILAARNPDFWLYYALMATAGSVIGGYVTFRLAFKGGEKALARRSTHKVLVKSTEIFKRWGFAAIVIPALLPPPVPMVPFVIAAGTMQYSTRRFVSALTLGRVVRYTALALLAEHYGRQARSWTSVLGHPVFWVLSGSVVLAMITVFIVFNSKTQHTART